jgi:hypothetical protein
MVGAGDFVDEAVGGAALTGAANATDSSSSQERHPIVAIPSNMYEIKAKNHTRHEITPDTPTLTPE